ncbi:MAG: dTDP-4-dehydrorhamnose 3,5-epimerase [Patescibacteria group bacterium]
MDKHDLGALLQKKLYVQSYEKKPVIEGVKVVPLTNFVGEEGDFGEVLRLAQNGDIAEFPNFHIRQISRTSMFPKAIKAWHLHFKQDEVWFVLPTSHLVVGLWDTRTNSPTNDIKMRLSCGYGKSYLIFIPHGVAHGCANFSNRAAELFYFMNEQFDKDKPDENRLPYTSAGESFWTPERD